MAARRDSGSWWVKLFCLCMANRGEEHRDRYWYTSECILLTEEEAEKMRKEHVCGG